MADYIEAQIELRGLDAFVDTREEAKEAAERLASRVGMTGILNDGFWSEDIPCYGSVAYQRDLLYYEGLTERMDRNGCM